MRDFIPQIQPWIDESELVQLKRVVDSTYVTEHTLTAEFEGMIRDLTGSTHAIAMTNGTVALFCCLKALGIGEGDEVIVPNMTFIASSNAVIMTGAKPVFCEIKPTNFCIDEDKVAELITEDTRAIMPVHLYGQSCDMHAMERLAREYDIKVVEDAAQGVGVKFDGKHVGTFGDMGILSFYGNKTITCGEGGVVLTDSDKLKEECYKLKNHGRLTKGTFIHEDIGYNFCFTEMQAAIGISQMNKLSKIIERKKNIYDLYHRRLSPVQETLRPVYTDPRCSPVWWFTSFLTTDKSELKSFLLDKGVQTRDFFYPLDAQPCYSKDSRLPVTEKVFNEGISLPSSYIMTDEEQNYVIDSILDFYGGAA